MRMRIKGVVPGTNMAAVKFETYIRRQKRSAFVCTASTTLETRNTVRTTYSQCHNKSAQARVHVYINIARTSYGPVFQQGCHSGLERTR